MIFAVTAPSSSTANFRARRTWCRRGLISSRRCSPPARNCSQLGDSARFLIDSRPNKDAAWKFCEMGDVLDCEKTLGVHVDETRLIENRGEQAIAAEHQRREKPSAVRGEHVHWPR
jgi:hypothetical protein